MSSHEFAEWQAFDRLEPIGGPHIDALFQRLSFIVYNSMRMLAGSKVEGLTEEKFRFIWHQLEEEEASTDDLKSRIMGTFQAL